MKGNVSFFWTQAISPPFQDLALSISTHHFCSSFSNFGHSLLCLSLLCYFTYEGCLVRFFSDGIRLGQRTDDDRADKHLFLILKNSVSHSNSSCWKRASNPETWAIRWTALTARREQHQPFLFLSCSPSYCKSKRQHNESEKGEEGG